MEGLNLQTPERYFFTYRERVLAIRTETDGRQMRFVFNHPTELNDAGTRARRIHRDSKAMIEMEARKVIDELLDQTVAIPRQDYEALMKELERLRAMEKVALRTKRLPEPARVQPGSCAAQTAQADLPAVFESPSIGSIEPMRTISFSHNALPPFPLPFPSAAANPDKHDLSGVAAEIVNSTEPASAPGLSAAGAVEKEMFVVNCQPLKRAHESKVSWPPKADLLEMLWTKRGTQIARELKCHPQTVFEQADRWKLPRPPHNHWLKQKFGAPIVIPEAIAAQIARLRREAPEPGIFPTNQTTKSL